MRLQALVEIPHAHERRDHRQHQRQQRQHGENRQTPARGPVLVYAGLVGVVHADEFEDEVGHAGEVDADDAALADVGFAAGEVGGEEEEGDGDGEGGDGDPEFEFGRFRDDDEELNGEAEEEEEVEFEQSDVDLQISVLVNVADWGDNGQGGVPDRSDTAV
jgi:hypothetical protein